MRFSSSVLVLGLIVGAANAGAQTIIGGDGGPNVVVDYGVLDRIAPRPGMAPQPMARQPAPRLAAPDRGRIVLIPPDLTTKREDAKAKAKPAARVEPFDIPAAIAQVERKQTAAPQASPTLAVANPPPPSAALPPAPEPAPAPALAPSVAAKEKPKPPQPVVAKQAVVAKQVEKVSPKPETAAVAKAPVSTPAPVAAKPVEAKTAPIKVAEIAPPPVTPTASPAPAPVEDPKPVVEQIAEPAIEAAEKTVAAVTESAGKVAAQTRALPELITPPPAPVPAAQTAAAPAVPPEAAAPAMGDDDSLTISFAANSAQLPDNATGMLDRLATRMKADESLQVQLLAYAEGEDASASKARRLSLQRAVTIRSFLADKGVRSTRMVVRALGNKVPDGPADRVDLEVMAR